MTKPKTIKKVRIEENAEVNTYAYIDHANSTLISKIEEDQPGKYNLAMCSMVFSAFTIEAFCNHIGRKMFQDWDKHDRKSIIQKVELFASTFSMPLDWTIEPWLTVKSAIRFRNLMAHGRSEEIGLLDEVAQEKYVPPGIFETKAKTEWQSMLDKMPVKEWISAIHVAMEVIHNASGVDGFLFDHGHRTRQTEMIEKPIE